MKSLPLSKKLHPRAAGRADLQRPVHQRQSNLIPLQGRAQSAVPKRTKLETSPYPYVQRYRSSTP
jgi:hypothetical protein